MLNKYYLADRSNKTIDILDLSTSPRPSRKSSTSEFAGFTGNNDISGPDGVSTVTTTRRFGSETGGLVAGPDSGPGQVWVLNTDASQKHYRGEWRTRSQSAGQVEPMSCATIRKITWS